jgi:hypothetical protein
MKHTVRDVVLLGAAMSAFMLLVVLSPVGAEEVPAPAAAATVRVATEAAPATAVRLAANLAPVTQRQASIAATPAAEAQVTDEPAAEEATVERRCDHVRRIGKVRFTRCD